MGVGLCLGSPRALVCRLDEQPAMAIDLHGHVVFGSGGNFCGGMGAVLQSGRTRA